MTKIFITASIVALTAAAASASPLNAGGSVSPIPVYANSLALATPVSPLSSVAFNSPGGLYSGFLNSQVYTNAVDNPFGAGFLSFAYLISNNAGSSNSLGRFTVNGYGSFGADVGSEPSIPGIAAFEATRQADGDSIGFSFLNAGPFSQVTAGGNSLVYVVHTNATTYGINPAAVIDGDIAVAAAYSPLPTPGAGALLGLGAIAAFRRRR